MRRAVWFGALNFSITLAASVVLWGIIVAAWQTVAGEIVEFSLFSAGIGFCMVYACRW